MNSQTYLQLSLRENWAWNFHFYQDSEKIYNERIPTNKVLGETPKGIVHHARVNVTDFKEVINSTKYMILKHNRCSLKNYGIYFWLII